MNRKEETKGKKEKKERKCKAGREPLSLKGIFERTNPEAGVGLVKRLRHGYRHLLHFHPAALGEASKVQSVPRS